MKTHSSPRFFYQFLGAHSLLIGLLPFFLPVYLWQQGLSLSGLCLLIGVSGLSFAAALGLWQRIWHSRQIRHLISMTFFLELVLVVCVGIFTTTPGAALHLATAGSSATNTTSMMLAAAMIGIANGAYNAFFWTTQRSLFLQQLGVNDTGKQYGNFQIFVTLFLKVGILLGGWLLETGGFVWLLAISAGISFASSSYLSTSSPLTTDKRITRNTRTTLLGSIHYRDSCGSKPTFAIDGIFLYLESHFWTVSLFLIVRQDYSKLGVTVVMLALIFALLFFLIKNQIDKLPADYVYRVAVWLYAASWLLRYTINDESVGISMLVSLVFITFFSSFFRLAFNKRFFDIARQSGSVSYLLVKSYSSQCYLGMMFLLMALVQPVLPLSDESALQSIYIPAAVLALVYLRFRNLQQPQ